MNTKSKLGLAMYMALMLLIFSATLALAATYQLSGRVTDQSGNPLAGTLIEVIDPSTGSITASATTDSSGYYSLPLSDGVYDIQVTPPLTSGFQVSITTGYAITNDTTLDIVLVPVTFVEVSGHLLDPLGNPVSQQLVILSGSNLTNNLTDNTDAAGRYSFDVPAGSYYISGRGNRPGSSLCVPAEYTFSINSSISVTSDTVVDLTLPTKRVNVHVQDPAGNPVTNVNVGATRVCNSNLLFGALSVSGCSEERAQFTDINGNTTLWLFATPASTSYILTATPPS